MDFTRKVTHNGYKNPEKLKKYYHRVIKKIYSKPDSFDENYTQGRGSDYLFYDDDCLVSKSGGWVIPIILGLVSFGFLLIFFPGREEKSEIIDWVFFIISLLTLIFSFVYGFTMPKRKNILNRKDGFITFSGFLWQPDITMEFRKTEFSYSTGGEDVVGAFQLQIIRPNKWQTFAIAGYVGIDCYENMSFITWYMDRNRPLPPGTSFDGCRQKDFERRKSEGFPKPLYPSAIPTPEFTEEQQKEREKIGGW
ncbi:hypothetical protein [Spongiivirga citrea]|uniref:Uncharacterized protein n=1 Tax=Spongiivirga citrea TaxID=1481457 RepID=A0A6M0CNK4_9FLAO|nr:hypothetical protein [Spongiivirga citrea]NER18523.1 hypothetical protein [Spongiivirga citrea]